MFNKLKRLKFTAPRGLNKTVVPIPTKGGFSPLFVYGFDLCNLCLPTEWEVHIKTRNIVKPENVDVYGHYTVTIVVKADDYWKAMREALYGLAPGDTIISIKEKA